MPDASYVIQSWLVACWLEYHPVHRSVADLIPSWGASLWDATN